MTLIIENIREWSYVAVLALLGLVLWAFIEALVRAKKRNDAPKRTETERAVDEELLAKGKRALEDFENEPAFSVRPKNRNEGSEK